MTFFQTLQHFFARPDVRTLLTLIAIIIVVVAIVLAVRAARKKSMTTAQEIAAVVSVMAPYNTGYGRRQPVLQQTGVTHTTPITNFFVSTAYDAACGWNGSVGVVSTDILTAAIRGGARCLDIAVFPSNPTDPAAVPVVGDGTASNRVLATANSVAFDQVCRTIVEMALGGGGNSGIPNPGDPLFLMLRINAGQTPGIYTSIAASLSHWFGKYRLPYTYYRCGRQTKLFSDPLDVFTGRVMIMADGAYTGTPLEEYINLTFTGAPEGTTNALQQTLWTDVGLAALDTTGRSHITAITQQRLCMDGPMVGSFPPGAVTGKDAFALGMHFVAMPFWGVAARNAALAAAGTAIAAGGPPVFSTYSLQLKPAALQFVPITAPAPIEPPAAANPRGGILTLPTSA